MCNIYKIQKIHVWLFVVTALYLSWESLRGLIISQDFRVVRWLVLFLVLGALCLILRNQNGKVYPQLSKIIVICAIGYYLAYLCQGLIAEGFRGISRYDTQGTEWAGSAYAVYGFIIAIPSAMVLYHNKTFLPLAILLTILAVVISHYYNSRVLFFVIILFLFISPFIMQPKNSLLFIGIVLVTWFIMVFLTRGFETFGWYSDMVRESSQLRPMDVGRFAHVQASIQSLNESGYTFMVGHGTYMSHWEIPFYLKSIYVTEAPWWANSVPDYIRTTGLPAMISDWGAIGTFLIIMNFAFTAVTLFVQRNKWILFVAVLGISFAWLYVSNILDITLFWLMIIPYGLLYQLNKKEVTHGIH
jgi:hypothetical protein